MSGGITLKVEDPSGLKSGLSGLACNSDQSRPSHARNGPQAGTGSNPLGWQLMRETLLLRHRHRRGRHRANVASLQSVTGREQPYL